MTAGASAPESVVQECVEYLRAKFRATVEPRTIRDEDVHFPLPRELRTIGAYAGYLRRHRLPTYTTVMSLATFPTVVVHSPTLPQTMRWTVTQFHDLRGEPKYENRSLILVEGQILEMPKPNMVGRGAG